MAVTSCYTWALDDPTYGTIWRWVCDVCDSTGLQPDDALAVRAGNEHLFRRHDSTGIPDMGVASWNIPPPPFPPEPERFTATASPSLYMSGSDGVVITEWTWRCDLDYGWGVADSEEGVLRKSAKHVKYYHS